MVERITILAEEGLDGSWQPSPGFRAQEKRCLVLRQATPHLNDAQQATPRHNGLKPRPPPARRRGPLPRMPPNATNIPTASRDNVRVHSTNNTFTLSAHESFQAQAYLRTTPLQIGARTTEFQVYAPPPNHAFLSIMINAYDSFNDAEILKDLQLIYPAMSVVDAHRMEEINQIIVAMLEDCLPRWIVYICLHPVTQE
ncbi:hypothetical protein HPB51_026956 [Rhipicephalus microplus]|uniref:Uncharacterized protein n=1 Tax=Rhipicephalus microplus TaxID=6941 RepID=A0A9J6D1J4_RHIMP|nr:hypothetical protein HPB51_026956 [Rhipicephalus microplus]